MHQDQVPALAGTPDGKQGAECRRPTKLTAVEVLGVHDFSVRRLHGSARVGEHGERCNSELRSIFETCHARSIRRQSARGHKLAFQAPSTQPLAAARAQLCLATAAAQLGHRCNATMLAWLVL